jgi:hypothetical protein
MIVALAALLASQEQSVTMPAGASQPLLELAAKVGKALEAGDLEAARRLASRLPALQFTIVWDDSAVEARRRPVFRQALDQAVAAWREAVPELSVSVGPSGPLSVSFQDRLPPAADGYLPAGSVLFTSDDPSEPAVEAVLALNREEPPQPAERNDVRNDMVRAIGAYLGLAEGQRLLSPMRRLDSLTTVPTRVGPAERRAVMEIQAACATLRKAAENGDRFVLAQPAVAVRTLEFAAPPVLQGGVLSWDVEVANTGNAPLRIEAQPDCGCFALQYSQELAPGQASLLRAFVNTFDVPGPFDKRVYLRTNDPERPLVELKFATTVRPVYRALRAEGPGPVLLQGGSGTATVYVLHQPDRKFRILSQALTGAKGTVEVEPWAGDLADPDYGEPATPRVGYRARLSFEGVRPGGRTVTTLQLRTDDPDFPNIFVNVPVQSGIAAVPERLYLGDVSRTSRRGAFLVSRPGTPFRVTGVKPGSKHLLAEAFPYRDGGDYRVVVELLDTAPAGNFEADVVVATDDPAQPEIRVQVTALVP